MYVCYYFSDFASKGPNRVEHTVAVEVKPRWEILRVRQHYDHRDFDTDWLYQTSAPLGPYLSILVPHYSRLSKCQLVC